MTFISLSEVKNVHFILGKAKPLVKYTFFTSQDEMNVILMTKYNFLLSYTILKLNPLKRQDKNASENVVC